MAIGIKSNIDGSGEILKDGVNILTLGTDDSVQGAFVDTDGFRLSGVPGYNYIINGGFDIWQRSVSQTTNGYGSDDRWYNSNIGSTRTHSRQSFGVGETFPDGTPAPKYYSRTIATSVASATNHVLKVQTVEYVSTLAGKKATLSFYARADSDKSIAIEFAQGFGTGGSPSAVVTGIGTRKIALTTTWQRFVVTVDIPSISGKTLGSNSNDGLALHFWFDAGTDFNARTNSLGHQSGTFDIACVSLVEGDVDIKPIPRSYVEELSLCQRYYITNAGVGTVLFNPVDSGMSRRGWVSFPVRMRTSPSCYVAVSNIGAPWISPISQDGALVFGDTGGNVECGILIFTADAEL